MVGPKKEALAIAEGQLKEAEDKLAVKKASDTTWSMHMRHGCPRCNRPFTQTLVIS